MFGSFFLQLHHHPRHLTSHLAPHHGARASRCPSPLLRDVGPLNTGQGAGERVTEGGPRKWEAQPVSKMSHDFRRGSFSPFCHPSLSPLISSHEDGKSQEWVNDHKAGHTTTAQVPAAEGRQGTPNDNRAGQTPTGRAKRRREWTMTTRMAQRRRDGPRNETAGSTTTRRAQ